MASDAATQRKKWRSLGVIVAVLTACTAIALRSDRFSEFESRTWDWRLEAVARRSSADPAIKLIVVDQGSLDYFSNEESIRWPWPREMYEPVLRFLERAGARGVAFDVLYTEPSSYGVADDAAFAQTIGQGVPTVMAVAGRRDRVAESTEDIAKFVTRAREGVVDLNPFLAPGASIAKFGGVTLPIPEILDAATRLGNVTSDADSDGVFRHVSPIAEIAGVPVPTLPLALFLASGQSLSSTVRDRVDDDGRLTVRFSGGAQSYKTYSIRSIIQSWVAVAAGESPAVDPSEFKDALVFVGMVAPGLLDLRPVPLERYYPGVEFNATVLDNLRHESFIRKVRWPWASAIAALLIGLGTASALFFRKVRTQVLALGILFIGAVLLIGEAAVLGWWMPLVVPIGAALLGVIAALGVQYELEGRQHRFIKDAFRYYVSPSVIDQIVADPSNLSLGGVRRELTIFFSDIAGFTTISEKLEAGKLSALLNRFLSEMTDIILKCGGTVDKYVGDAIVAFWNAPLQIPDHAGRAVEAALACQARLTELQDELMRDFGVSIRMRVGLHTGAVSVGNFGSRDRFNYTMIGDAANLASRLEGANKYFGTLTLVSGATRAQVKNGTAFRKVADIQVVGKSEVVTVFEPLPPGGADPAAYRRALEIFEAGERDAALALFRTIPEDPVAKAYIARIEREAREGTNHRASWNLTEK